MFKLLGLLPFNRTLTKTSSELQKELSPTLKQALLSLHLILGKLVSDGLSRTYLSFRARLADEVLRKKVETT